MDKLYIVQMGCGLVGKTLLRQIYEQQDAIAEKIGLRLEYAKIGELKGIAGAAKELQRDELARLLQTPMNSPEFMALPFVQPRAGEDDLFEGMEELRGERVALVDVTAAGGTDRTFVRALELGWGGVSSNKKPFVTSLDIWRKMMAAGENRLRIEATVGAGLPVHSTLETLLLSGDEIKKIWGCFSGTLGYIFSRLGQGASFSEAVREAKASGYTEPDPREDLSGMDVARKALILARRLGYNLELANVQLARLYPAKMDNLSPAEFMTQLDRLNEDYAQKTAAAHKKGCRLRHIAEVENGQCRVGLKEVNAESLAGSLQGPDNIIVFETARYTRNPLVIIGPGAGAEVTAGGVLGDIISLGRQSWKK